MDCARRMIEMLRVTEGETERTSLQTEEPERGTWSIPVFSEAVLIARIECKSPRGTGAEVIARQEDRLRGPAYCGAVASLGLSNSFGSILGFTSIDFA
jgi:hypothetical protein